MQNGSIRVGMADYKTATNSSSLITTGLGSCVGVCLWDPLTKVGGMIHIMLPDSSQGKPLQNKAKYADTGIVLLVDEMRRLGANQARLVAKIAGGAQMFAFPNSNSIMRIGERNVEAVKRCLDLLNIKLLAEDTGGSFGRTIEFFTNNAELRIKTINRGEKII